MCYDTCQARCLFMKNKKIVTVQDISCYGQCSITVALPILSAYGFETAILPSAILSTHTTGFKRFVVHDLNEQMKLFIEHWIEEGIKYDCLYTGYLGSVEHFKYIKQIKDYLLNPGSKVIVDPVMGDNGKLYPAFDMNYVEAMKGLLKEADVILPNITEAAFLTGLPFKAKYDKDYILEIIKELKKLTDAIVILTGVSYQDNKTGVVVFDNEYQYYEHDKIQKSYHGTGDVYSSTFIGNYLKNNDAFKSACLAADFVYDCIKNTLDDDSHGYGVKFEPLLSKYIK